MAKKKTLVSSILGQLPMWSGKPSDILGFVLFFTLVGLALYSGELDHAIMSMLFFGGAIMINRQQPAPNKPADLEGRLIGVGILINVIVFCVMYEPSKASESGLASGANPWLRIYPAASALSWLLVCHGLKGFRTRWQIPFLFLFLGLPWLVIRQLFDMAIITAVTVSLVLRLMGFDAYMEQPLFVGIEGSRVNVNIGCSGMEAMTYLLGLSALALLAFQPPSWLWYVLVPPLAVLLAFVINIIRVTSLALFNFNGRPDLFDSFHVGLGSQAFSGSSVGLFCVGYYAVHWWCQRRKWTTKVRSVKSNTPDLA